MDIVTLYENKCDAINGELDGLPAKGSKLLVSELSKSLSATILAAEALARVTDAFANAVSHMTDTQQKILATRESHAQLASKLKSAPISGTTGLEEMSKFLQDSICQQLALNGQMQLYAVHTFDLLSTSLGALLAGEDSAPRDAFISTLRSGVIDSLLGKIPGVDFLILGVRAVEAALTARAKRRESASDYLRSIETYNEACHAWITGADAVAEGFNRLGTEDGQPDVSIRQA